MGTYSTMLRVLFYNNELAKLQLMNLPNSLTYKWLGTLKHFLRTRSPTSRLLTLRDSWCRSWSRGGGYSVDHEGQGGHNEDLELHIAGLFWVEVLN